MENTRVDFDCHACELRDNCIGKPPYSRFQDKVNFDSQADIMILLDTPSSYDAAIGIPVVGLEGKLLENILWGFGYNSSEFYITCAVKCPLPPERKMPLIKKHIIPCYETNLVKQIEIVKPKLILNFGGRFWKWVSKSKTLNLKKDQGKTATVVIQNFSIKIIPLMSLARLLKSKKMDFDSDRYRMFTALSFLAD